MALTDVAGYLDASGERHLRSMAHERYVLSHVVGTSTEDICLKVRLISWRLEEMDLPIRLSKFMQHVDHSCTHSFLVAEGRTTSGVRSIGVQLHG